MWSVSVLMEGKVWGEGCLKLSTIKEAVLEHADTFEGEGEQAGVQKRLEDTGVFWVKCVHLFVFAGGDRDPEAAA